VNEALNAQLAGRRLRVERLLGTVLREDCIPARLQAAMRYAVLDGGKRLRPLLAYAAAEAVGGAFEAADIPGCAVELVHAYSLIHDDLPAMDDDVLRRGKPTCHVAFDEATAILAGDALQALAFELLVNSTQLGCGNAVRLQLVAELARAAGPAGMVGGQMLDIEAAGGQLDEVELGTMHGMKTGALIGAAVIMGALSTNVATVTQTRLLRDYARLAGLAFQVCDDILDVESGSETSGKEQGKDARHNKPTYTSMLGLPGARLRLQSLGDEALSRLDAFGTAADGLRQLTQLIIHRRA
jgi:geranylgeranyl diphosphate synthase, type II